MSQAQTEAQLMAYQALQEALDRRDNGGRNTTPADGRLPSRASSVDEGDTNPAVVWPQRTARRTPA